MVDPADSKSAVRKDVRVRLSFQAPVGLVSACTLKEWRPKWARMYQWLAILPCKENVESSILFGSTKKYMVAVAEWFRRNTVDVVYMGSNPIGHPKIMSNMLHFSARNRP